MSLSGVEVSPLGIGAFSWGEKYFWGYGKDYGKEDIRGAYQVRLLVLWKKNTATVEKKKTIKKTTKRKNKKLDSKNKCKICE
ncbi:MAG: hypothetical protein Devi2KO_40460 [Devosia indica]